MKCRSSSGRALVTLTLAVAVSIALAACGGGDSDGRSSDLSPDANPAPITNPTPIPLELKSDVIAVGISHSCALTFGGKVKCWGKGNQGAVGGGVADRIEPIEVNGLTNAVAVSVGGFDGKGTSCAVLRAGKIMCWGTGEDGQLGGGSTSNSTIPVEVSGITDAVAVAVGGQFACALRKGGSVTNASVMCWGNNQDRQLGIDGASSLIPVAVDVGLNFPDFVPISISAGATHSCVLMQNGAIHKPICWGNNRKAQAGQSLSIDSVLPADIDGLSAAVDAISTGSSHTCVVVDDGAITCWGANADGQLGNGAASILSIEPVRVLGISDAVGVSAGSSHTCALRVSGEVMCWGDGSSGKLGNGRDTGSSTSPVRVEGLRDVVAITAGKSHTCALRATGALLCWGESNLLGSFSSNSAVPVEVTGGAIFGK
jgi:alpha-tubulin suppressor-like RCC1 family protein